MKNLFCPSSSRSWTGYLLHQGQMFFHCAIKTQLTVQVNLLNTCHCCQISTSCNFFPHPKTPPPPFWAQHIPHMSVTAKISITITGFNLPLWGETTNEKSVLPFPQSVLNQLPLAPRSDVLPLCYQDSADSTSQFIEHIPLLPNIYFL